MNETKLKTKDLVSIGIFSVIYMVISLLSMIVAIVSPVVWLLWPGIAGIICSFIYVLLAAKVPKFGSAFLLSIITGLIYFAMGECTWTIVLTFAIVGILAELIRKTMGYSSNKGIIISSGVVAIGFIGSPLPMWLFQESYIKSIIEMGMDVGYVEAMQKIISIPSLLGMIVFAFIGGVIGALIGKKLFKKHFEKAGIV